MDNKILKVALLNETIKKNPEVINTNRGCAKSLATSFGVSTKMAKKVIQEANEKSPKEIAIRSKRPTVMDTNWPDLVQQFCLTKHILMDAVVSTGVTVPATTSKQCRKSWISQ